MSDQDNMLGAFPTPPEASGPMRRMAQRIASPVERFLHTEAGGGILLLVAAAVALLWANSPWSSSYTGLWHTPITVGIDGWSMTESLHFWINEGLMTFFFLVAGLEIKRELADGELSDLRRATLPLAAALGGMLVPAAIYLTFNTHAATRGGWGVPMATDIAFAVGVLSLLGKRVPAAMRVLLLAVAIIDDIGAILIIAIFYSTGISLVGLGVVAGGVGVLLCIRRVGVRPGAMYLIPLLIIWAGLHEAGIHPTIAGVIVGLGTPVRPWLSRAQFIDIAERSLLQFQRSATTSDGEDRITALRRLSIAGREAVSPVTRLAAGYHPWVAYLVMPLFAVANAGVNLGGLDFAIDHASSVILGVGAGLAVGKPLGVIVFAWASVKLGLCNLPRGVTWTSVAILGLVAGIGFTMAIFVAELAFVESPHLSLAKLAILAATALAAIAGLLLGRFGLSADVRGPANRPT